MTTENNEKLSLLDDVALKAQMLMANLKEGANDGYDHSVTSAGEKGLKSGKVSELTAHRPLTKDGAARIKRILEITKGNLAGRPM